MIQRITNNVLLQKYKGSNSNPSQEPEKLNVARKRREGYDNNPQRQKDQKCILATR